MREPGRQTEYRRRSPRRMAEEDDFDIEITEEDIRNYDLLGTTEKNPSADPEEEILFDRIGDSDPGDIDADSEEEKEEQGEEPGEKEKAAGRGKKRKRISILLLILILALIPAGIYGAGILTCRQGAAEYAAYAKEILSGMETPEKDGTIPDPQIDWDSLEKINPDLAGILYIPALDLAVPYTAGEESSYALSHTFSGTESPVGSISCSEDTDAAFSGMNAVLLGAVPRDGSLFGGFKKLFFQERLLQDQPCVFVFTRTWRRRYQVFAGFSAMNTDPVLCTFSADEKYRYYLSLAESRNALEGMEDISSYTQEEEPFLTLSAGSGKYRTYSRILCCILTGEESND